MRGHMGPDDTGERRHEGEVEGSWRSACTICGRQVSVGTKYRLRDGKVECDSHQGGSE